MNQQSNIKEATKNVWGKSPAGTTHAKDFNPGTKEFFEKVLHERFSKEHDFLINLVDYPQWKNKKVLEIGCGAGYDAYMFCKYGAEYTGIDIVPENIDRTKKHLDLYRLKGSILELDAEQLNFNEKFDLIYSFGVLHHIPNVDPVISKIEKSLKPEGTVFVALYNKYSVFYMLYLWLGDYILRRGFLRESFQDRLSRIEFTESNDAPYVKVYTRPEIRRLFYKYGLQVASISTRKLSMDDFPRFRYIENLYKYAPQSILDILAKRWGWYLCVEAKKVSKCVV